MLECEEYEKTALAPSNLSRVGFARAKQGWPIDRTGISETQYSESVVTGENATNSTGREKKVSKVPPGIMGFWDKEMGKSRDRKAGHENTKALGGEKSAVEVIKFSGGPLGFRVDPVGGGGRL